MAIGLFINFTKCVLKSIYCKDNSNISQIEDINQNIIDNINIIGNNVNDVFKDIFKKIKVDQEKYNSGQKYLTDNNERLTESISRLPEQLDFYVAMVQSVEKLMKLQNNPVGLKTGELLISVLKKYNIKKMITNISTFFTKFQDINNILDTTSSNNMKFLTHIQKTFTIEVKNVTNNIDTVSTKLKANIDIIKTKVSHNAVQDSKKYLNLFNIKVNEILENLYDINSDIFKLNNRNIKQYRSDLETAVITNKKIESIIKKYDTFIQQFNLTYDALNKVVQQREEVVTKLKNQNNSEENIKKIQLVQAVLTELYIFIDLYKKLLDNVKKAKDVIQIYYDFYKNTLSSESIEYLVINLPKKKLTNTDVLNNINNKSNELMDMLESYVESARNISVEQPQNTKQIQQTTTTTKPKVNKRFANRLKRLLKVVNKKINLNNKKLLKFKDHPNSDLVNSIQSNLNDLTQYTGTAETQITTNTMLKDFKKYTTQIFKQINNNFKLLTKDKSIGNTKDDNKSAESSNVSNEQSSMTEMKENQTSTTNIPETNSYQIYSRKFLMLLFLLLVAIFLLIIRVILRRGKNS